VIFQQSKEGVTVVLVRLQEDRAFYGNKGPSFKPDTEEITFPHLLLPSLVSSVVINLISFNVWLMCRLKSATSMSYCFFFFFFFLLFALFWGRVFPLAQADHKLTIYLPQPPVYWDYRCVPQHLVLFCFWGRVSLCSPGWPCTDDSPALSFHWDYRHDHHDSAMPDFYAVVLKLICRNQDNVALNNLLFQNFVIISYQIFYSIQYFLCDSSLGIFCECVCEYECTQV
jgi:hypothetical protein